jgi:ornithine carbamoyltransferase
VARTAALVNGRLENIGARRLHTVMTTLLEDVLFELPDRGRDVAVDAALVRDGLRAAVEDEDLRKYILVAPRARRHTPARGREPPPCAFKWPPARGEGARRTLPPPSPTPMPTRAPRLPRHPRPVARRARRAARPRRAHARGEYRARPLAGRTLAMIFMKSSTRTRVSFEAGTFQLGGHALFLSPRDVQLGRGEPIADTARVLSRYVDGIMIRTFAHAEVEELARHATVPVINGLTDLLHPCQVLADVQTMVQHLGGYAGKRVAWIGDGNNMANSWLNAAYPARLRPHARRDPRGTTPTTRSSRARRGGAGAGRCATRERRSRARHVVNTDSLWRRWGRRRRQQLASAPSPGYTVDERTRAGASRGRDLPHCLPRTAARRSPPR